MTSAQGTELINKITNLTNQVNATGGYVVVGFIVFGVAVAIALGLMTAQLVAQR